MNTLTIHADEREGHKLSCSCDVFPGAAYGRSFATLTVKTGDFEFKVFGETLAAIESFGLDIVDAAIRAKAQGIPLAYAQKFEATEIKAATDTRQCYSAKELARLAEEARE